VATRSSSSHAPISGAERRDAIVYGSVWAGRLFAPFVLETALEELAALRRKGMPQLSGALAAAGLRIIEPSAAVRFWPALIGLPPAKLVEVLTRDLPTLRKGELEVVVTLNQDRLELAIVGCRSRTSELKYAFVADFCQGNVFMTESQLPEPLRGLGIAFPLVDRAVRLLTLLVQSGSRRSGTPTAQEPVRPGSAEKQPHGQRNI
jgi:hypothetical protein